MNGRSEIVHLLLESGADKEILTFLGKIALQFAVEMGSNEVVHLLQTFSPFKRKRMEEVFKQLTRVRLQIACSRYENAW